MTLRAVPVAALVLAALTAAPAPAQDPGRGQFGITPARRDLAGRPPARLVPTRVANTTDAAMDVTVFSVFLTQQTDGSFVFGERPADLRAANNVLTPAPTSFRMDPGDVRTVRLTWNTLPPKARAAYMGVVFQAVPIIDGRRNLNVTNRLLSINFLRLPGTYRSSGRFDSMQVRQAPEPRVLRFIPRVVNTGEIHDAPKRGRLVIETPSGRDLYTQRWKGDVVLPGVKRDFPIDVRKVFPKGRYVAAAVMDFGDSKHQVIRTPFTLTAPNTLPSAEITVGDFAAGGTIGKPARLTARVANTGTAPAGTVVSLSLFQVDGPDPEQPLATRRVPVEDLAPGAERAVSEQLGTLVRGHYRAVLRYRDSTDVVRTLTAEFDAVEEKGFFERFTDWIADHAVLIVVVAALLALLLLATYFLRRQRRLERALAARQEPAGPTASTAGTASEPPPAVPPGGGGGAEPPSTDDGPVGTPAVIDINTASVAELQQLPGIGPKAAERIVEHREEFGPFASLEDLAEVQGFSAARVARLADRARV